MSPRDVRVSTPAVAQSFDKPRTSPCSRASKTQLAWGSTRAACQFPFLGVVADKQCTCPASKLMRERYPPTPPFHCGENEIRASLISSASVGATPTPATSLVDSTKLIVDRTQPRSVGSVHQLSTLNPQPF